MAEEAPTGKNAYWVSYQYRNGTIGTWTDYADTPDEFIDDLLKREGDYIAKLLELEQDVGAWPTEKNLKISIAKYNQRLKPVKRQTKSNLSRDEAKLSYFSKMTFRIERDLQLVLRANIGQLEPNLVIIDGGKERVVEVGRIDITAMDANSNIVVIELKRGTASPQAVDQILAYMNAVANADKAPVRGILIAGDFHEKVLLAASDIHNLELKKYSFHFTFESAK